MAGELSIGVLRRMPKGQPPKELLREWGNFSKEDPSTLFEGVSKIAEGGQSQVFKAHYKVQAPTVSKPAATSGMSFISPRQWLNRSKKDASFTTFTPDSASGSTGKYRDVAVKKMRFKEMNNVKLVVNEIALTQQSPHPHVIEYIDTFISDSRNELWMVMEFMYGGPLSKVILKEKHLAESLVALVTHAMISALEYLHRNKRMHRDIKSDNILLGMGGEVKLADFGFATQLDEQHRRRQTMIGTPYWMAPEVIAGDPYGVEADVWSAGIVVIEMVDGLPPHYGFDPMQAMSMISCSGSPSCKADVSDALRDFIRCCCAKKAHKRSTSAELLRHPFLANPPAKEELQTFLAEFHGTAGKNRSRVGE